jgi:hypothetical protein
VKILKNCKDAIAKKGKEGKVIIIEMELDTKNGENNGSIETHSNSSMVTTIWSCDVI